MNVPPSKPADPSRDWGWSTRLAFRFAFAFFAVISIFEFSFPIAQI